MDILSSGLFLAQQANSTGSLVTTVVMFGAVFLIFYFFIIRPQNKQKKEMEKMIANVKKGDKVITIGGLHGTVWNVKDTTVVIKADDSCKLEYSKSAVASVVPKDEKLPDVVDAPAEKAE